MKTLLATLALSSLLSTTILAKDLIITDKISGGEAGITTQGFNMQIPIAETGDLSSPIDWDATFGMLKSRTNSYHTAGTNIQGSGTVYSIQNDGEAQYLVIGVEGRKKVINEFVEAVVRADYTARLGGTTMYSDYSETTGKLYDPNGGLNIATGANLLLGKNNKGQSLILGAEVSHNLNNDETIVTLKIGARL